MNDRKSKLTLEQIRELHHFDIPSLAEMAGVETSAVYNALIMHPIFQTDAEKIMLALSEHIGARLHTGIMDIVTWEEFLVLWVIRASTNEPADRNRVIDDKFYLVYARDPKHAATLAQHWFEQIPNHPYHYFTPYPEGFKIENTLIPGRLEQEER